EFGNIAAGASGENTTPFVFTISPSVTCGSVLQLALELNVQGVISKIPFTINVGNSQPVEFFSDNIEQGEAKWTHASGIKKKKNRVPVDPWVVSTKRSHSS